MSFKCRKDFISELPEEMALKILSYLGAKDLLRAIQTCKNWKVRAGDNSLWRSKCRRDRTLDGRRSWKDAYMSDHRCEMNWRVKPIRQLDLDGHYNSYISCFQLYGRLIVTGGSDKTVKIWSFKGKCLKTLVGHADGVNALQISDTIVVSCSRDKTVKVWNLEHGECNHTLRGHGKSVTCIHLNGTKVVSGSWDGTLRLWDTQTGACLRSFVGHTEGVTCVKYDRLVVSSADRIIKIWKTDQGQCLRTLEIHETPIMTLQFDGAHIVSHSLDMICIWGVESGQCLREFRHSPFKFFENPAVELKNDILVMADEVSLGKQVRTHSVKVWSLQTNLCLMAFEGGCDYGHTSTVTGVQFDDRFAITSSKDGTVKLWDMRTGAFIRDLLVLGRPEKVIAIQADYSKLVCSTGTKIIVLDFDDS